jgi:hypothetical protein
MRFATLVLCLALGVGCAPSEQEIRKEFEEFVTRHNACERDEDCTLITPGCPLGCWTPLRKDAADEGARLADELIDDYESAGRACEYDCVSACGARCTDKVCAPRLDAECPVPQ